jgi:hypothetical protein
MMRSKTVLLVVVLLVLGFGIGRISAAPGTLDSPGLPDDPASESYTLGDIYDRLNDGTQGAQSAFTEPASGPGTGTMHTLNQIMAIAPQIDATHGATQTHVLGGKTVWGLTSGQWGVITGTRPAAPVPRTGQTASSSPGDDGDLEKGVAWPDPRFTDNEDGTVTDKLTGLIWLKNANCFGSKPWAQALSDANGLANGSCGLTDGSSAGDWRLPNLRELQSLVHYGVYNPAVPNTAGTGKWTGEPFSGVQLRSYWSSTTVAANPYNGWCVFLGNGLVQSSYDKRTARWVWPVRGGQ